MVDLHAVKDAFTPEWKFPESKLVWLLRAALAALAAYALAVDPAHTTRGLLVTSALLGLATSVGFAFVPTRRPRTLRGAEAAALAAFFMHVGGHAFGWYEALGWYDKALHAFVPVATAVTLWALSQATDWIWDWRKVRPLKVGIYVFSMSVTLATLWEVLEFTMDQLAGTQEQNGLVDTMLDILADVGGAALGTLVVALATRYGHRHGMDAVSEEPKRPVPARAPLDRRSG